jgi:Phage endonuclease I
MATTVKRPALKLEPSFRSGLEKGIAEQLDAAGVEYEFEKHKFEYNVPARTSKYTPDFKMGTSIFIEAKGAFGRGPGRFTGDPAKERKKMVLMKEQHPELDMRIVFQRASAKIYPKSPTTNAAWAEANGYLWADKGQIPLEWIKEAKQQLKD